MAGRRLAVVKAEAGQLAYLKLAEAIASKWHYPPAAGVDSAIVAPASERMRTAGFPAG